MHITFFLLTFAHISADVFSDLTNTLTLAFWQTLFKEGFQTLRDYNLARGLAIHTEFDDLDLTSRSHMYPSHKLQNVFRFFSTVVWRRSAATRIRKIQHSILRVSGVYLRDINNKIFVMLHLNMSRLSICSSF